MKNLSVVLVALSAGTAPLASEPLESPTKVVKPSNVQTERSGQEAVREIRSIYESGGYADFLKELDDSYHDVKENGQLDQLSGMRIGYISDWHEWESRAISLQNEKNQELLDAVIDQKKTPFIEKVLSASAKLSDEAHQNAIIQMTSLRAMTPGSGKNIDENCLIDLDLEYEYKSLHMDLPGAPISDKKAKFLALKMEKMEKMLEASSTFEDASLKEMVTLYADGFDARLAQSWDAADLNALTNGKKKPADAVEEKVASILMLYQEKFSDLSKQFLVENEEN